MEDQATGTVQGLVGLSLALWIGTNVFEGTVKGSTCELVAYGTTARQEGNCSYTLNATLTGKLTGNSLEGGIVYAPQTNGNPDCAALECAATQAFAGSRPPP
jgi:hypothetical protein